MTLHMEGGSASRKDELSRLSTQELQEKLKSISRRGLDYLRSRDEDDMEDSFFEPSPAGSDEHIIREILRERGVIE